MPHQASVVVSDRNSAMTVRRRISALTNRSAAVNRVRACSSAASSVPLRWRARATLRRSLISSHLPDSGIGGAIQQPNPGGKDAEKKKTPPGLGAERADIEPHEGREEVADADAALHEAGAPAAGMIGPQLRHHRRTGRPFRADGNAD